MLYYIYPATGRLDDARTALQACGIPAERMDVNSQQIVISTGDEREYQLDTLVHRGLIESYMNGAEMKAFLEEKKSSEGSEIVNEMEGK